MLVLLAAVPQAAFAGQWYRCRYTGETRTSCCCTKAPPDSDPAQPQMTGADCCDSFRSDPAAMTARTEPPAELRVAAVHLAVATVPAHVVDLAAGIVQSPLERATAPPLRDEPLYLRHSSLLL